jgi:WD40 repeat protein
MIDRYPSNLFLLIALFLTGTILSMAVSSPVTAQAPVVQDVEDAKVFPVARYRTRSPNQTGNNNYFTMARRPGSPEMAVPASGAEDLLLYEDHQFSIRRIDPLLYHRDATWKNERSLYVASSRTPPDTGGVVMRFDRNQGQFHVVQKTPVNLLSLEFMQEELLAVGGQRYPEHKGGFYRITENGYDKIPLPKPIVLHEIDGNPRRDQALMGGEAGTVLLWQESDTYIQQTIPGRPLIKSIAWHPDGDRALIGGDQGRIYRYRDGQITRIVSDFEWTVQDIAWHPDGKYALLVGGTGRSDRGHWARLEGNTLETHDLSKPFFSVEWMDEDNALFGGQKVLWQYSQSTDPDDLGLKASLSASHRDAEVKQKITLSGYGSTYKANADSVARYFFRYNSGDSSGWQNTPDNNMRYHKEGIYTPTLIVESRYSDARDSDQVTVTVGDVEPTSWYSSLGSGWIYGGILVLLAGGLLYIFGFRSSGPS